MHDCMSEHSKMNEIAAIKMSFALIIDEYVEKSGNTYNNDWFVQDLLEVVSKYLGVYAADCDTIAENLADSIGILKVKEYMGQPGEQALKGKHYIQSVSFAPSDDVTIKIKGK